MPSPDPREFAPDWSVHPGAVLRRVLDKQDIRQAELAEKNEMRGPVFKVTNDPRVTPLREFFTELMELEPVNRRLSEMITALEVRYDLPGDHPLTGRFVPTWFAGVSAGVLLRAAVLGHWYAKELVFWLVALTFIGLFSLAARLLLGRIAV